MLIQTHFNNTLIDYLNYSTCKLILVEILNSEYSQFVTTVAKFRKKNYNTTYIKNDIFQRFIHKKVVKRPTPFIHVDI